METTDALTKAVATAINNRLDGEPGTIKLVEWLTTGMRMSVFEEAVDAMAEDWQAAHV